MNTTKTLTIVHWAGRIVAALILLMGVVPKFTGQAGDLADKLPGGTMAVMVIGLAELAAIVLMFIPKTALIGSGLAAMVMLGAIISHVVGPVGMEGDFAMMFGMALVAFVAAAVATVAGWKLGCGCCKAGESDASKRRA